MRSIILLAHAGIRKRKMQAVLTVTSLTVSVVLLATTLGIIRGAAKPFDYFFERLCASHILLFFDYAATDVVQLTHWLEKRADVAGVGLINPMYTPSTPLIFRNEKLDISIQLTERTESNLVQDQLLQLAGEVRAHPAIGEVWLPRHLADTYGIRLGDTLSVPIPAGLYPLRISALIVDPHYISGIVNPNRAWLAPGALSFFLPAGSIKDAMLGIRLKNPDAGDELWTELEKTGLFHGNHLTHQQFRSFFLSFYQLVTAILAVFGLLALTMSLFIMTSTIAAAIHADYRLIGISKAVGLTPGNVVASYVIQYLWLGVLALFPGFLGSYFLIQWLLRSLVRSVGLTNVGLSYVQPFGLAAMLTLATVAIGTLCWASRAGQIKTVDAIRWGAPPPKRAFMGLLRQSTSLLTFPLPIFLALRFLLTNRRRTISGIFSLLLAIQVIVFSINVAHSFGQMKNNKAQWGLDNSDLEVTLKKDIYLPLKPATFAQLIAHNEQVLQVNASRFLALSIPPQGGKPGMEVYGRAYDTEMDQAGLARLEGRHPQGSHELSLCVLTARHFGKKTGDSLEVLLEGQPLRVQIAGIYQDVSNLGHGFRLSGAAVRQVNPLFEPDTYGLKLRTGVPLDTFKNKLQETFGDQIGIEGSVEDRKAVVQVVTGMQLALLSLSVLFVFIIGVTLFNDMVLSIREQRRSLGLLKMLGFTPPQLRRPLILKSLLLIMLSLLAGVPLSLWLSPRLISWLTAGIGLAQFPFVPDVSKTLLVLPGLLAFGYFVSSAVSRRLLQGRSSVLKISLFMLLGMLWYGPGLLGQAAPALPQIDQYLNSIIRQGGAPGFSVVLVKDNQIVLEKGYGVEVAGQARPMTAQSVLAAGSLTKSFTALAMMQLVAQGKVKLDDPVVRHLPWFRTANKDRSDRITIRMLLNNTSGLQEGFSPASGDFSDQAVEQLVRSFRSAYLVKEPGISFAYSNAGFAVAGLIIHQVSGIPYISYLEKNIFQPLQMFHTSTDPARFAALKTGYGHHFGIDRGIPAGPEPESGEYIPAGLLLRTTAHDLGNYLLFLLNEGKFKEKEILSPMLVQEWWARSIAFPGLEKEAGGTGASYYYGLGWITADIHGRTMIFHGGSTGTMSSWMLFDPQRKIGAAILLNLDYSFIDPYRFPTHFTILHNLLELAGGEPRSDYGAPRIEDPTLNNYELPAEKRSRYLGRYRITDAGRAFVFRGANLEIELSPEGELLGRIFRQEKVLQEFTLDFVTSLSAVTRNLAKPATITFNSDNGGHITGGYYFGMRFVRQKEEALAGRQSVISAKGDLAFTVSLPWVVRWEENGFTLASPADPSCTLRGGWLSEDIDPSIILQQYQPDYELLTAGLQQTELVGPYVWKQQCFVTRQGALIRQHALHYTRFGQRKFFVLLTVSDGRLSRQTQATLLPLVQSLDLQSGY